VRVVGVYNEKGFKVRFSSFQIFFLFLTIIASFTGTLFIKIPVGHIHLFPYRFLMFFMWFLFVINIILKNWRFNISNIRVKVYLKFLGLWLCYSFISLAWAISKFDGVRNIILLFNGISMIFFLVHYFRDLNGLKRLYFLWMLIFAALLLVGIWEVTTGNHLTTSALSQEERLWMLFAPTTVFTNQNDYAAFIVLTLPMLISFIRYYPKSTARVFGIIFFITGSLLLIETISRICYVAAFLGMAFWVIFFLRLKAKFMLLSLTILFAVIVLVAFPIQTRYFLDKVETQVVSMPSTLFPNEAIESEGVRLRLIRNALYFSALSAGFGVGAGNFEYYMENFKIYPAYHFTNAHNWWVEILTNYGMFIFAGYLIFYFSLFCSLWRVYKKVNNRTEKMLCEALLVGLVSFVMASISPSSAIAFRPQWIFIGFALAFLNCFRIKETEQCLKCIS
jgi:teichuronic acid biosynthesis protein TuaE